MEEHDKHPQQFNQLYKSHWGNTLYCRTKRDDPFEATVVQRVKMAKRYAPAQHDISAQHNRMMYTLVKLLWLHSPQGSRTSPEKTFILKVYQRIQHRILVEDPVLCKAGIPLPKINTKTVRDFIRRQERLLNMRATKQPLTITKTTSISSADLPPAPHQPAVLPAPDYPLMEYVPTPSTAGTKVLKERTDVVIPLSRPQPLLSAPLRKTPPDFYHHQTCDLPLCICSSPCDCWSLHTAHDARQCVSSSDCWPLHTAHNACQSVSSCDCWSAHLILCIFAHDARFQD
ncbi:uncharacterized protein LOC125715607 [Brienomyrus brachyistius]|uniref:uncharacterized protein LOC125715607 n=1 Tax=Brienomyrus brachyistius TaxID=42636 RepID=UPI0020B266B7|nr:uncharacterized protein LOC125715606 isoform X1 [Brienomyrus brachyistius]XP_048843327.1 uncharacterized protein LOC125715606 isoform X2 [Brienomyrus brachyistius]XP_048843328.1 uncharacterized protein LOC125715606 isoform X2 [Brienomyrus brachyistius]XP_048843329.1 uncharacterized protein LOC125715607 [Brienomyrus brachyistius]